MPVEGLIEVDESYFGGVRKGKRGPRALLEKRARSRFTSRRCRPL